MPSFTDPKRKTRRAMAACRVLVAQCPASPTGADDNEEVRHGRAKSYLPLPHKLSDQQAHAPPTPRSSPNLMHLAFRRCPSPALPAKHFVDVRNVLTHVHVEQLSENNDFCAACGASGFLLCCDGCDRSFHFSCLDPPLNENASELNEPWYCYICVAKRPLTAEQTGKVPRGLFASLVHGIRKRNPSNFSLPQELRDYFEGVAGDKHGSFIEAVHARPK